MLQKPPCLLLPEPESLFFGQPRRLCLRRGGVKPFVPAILRVLLVSAMLAGCGGIGLVKQAPCINT